MTRGHTALLLVKKAPAGTTLVGLSREGMLGAEIRLVAFRDRSTGARILSALPNQILAAFPERQRYASVCRPFK